MDVGYIYLNSLSAMTERMLTSLVLFVSLSSVISGLYLQVSELSSVLHGLYLQVSELSSVIHGLYLQVSELSSVINGLYLQVSELSRGIRLLHTICLHLFCVGQIVGINIIVNVMLQIEVLQ